LQNPFSSASATRASSFFDWRRASARRKPGDGR
jgi:hypothetical protein